MRLLESLNDQVESSKGISKEKGANRWPLRLALTLKERCNPEGWFSF